MLYCSAGKYYIKVYINDVAQTDVDVDSISWTENINAPAIARFNLGRAFDNTKPTMKSVVKIKYHDVLMYQGYITEIIPGDKPESIQINCQGRYWNINLTKKYFLVGHKPKDANEYYFTTIKQALSNLGFSYDIGNFIPQEMNLYGEGKADCITELVTNSGNFGWFIRPDGSYRIWKAGAGAVVNLAYQALGSNLGLFQVIKHSFKENITGIVNKFRVLMGNWTIRRVTNAGDGSGYSSYTRIRRRYVEVFARPDWNPVYERLATKHSGNSYGWNWQEPGKEEEYAKVFTRYYFDLPASEVEIANWNDTYPPKIIVYAGSPRFWRTEQVGIEGFTISYPEVKIERIAEWPYTVERVYKEGKIVFSEPQYVYTTDRYGNKNSISSVGVKLILCKELTETYTTTTQTDPDTAPIEDSDAPYMFYTSKMGTWSDTIIGVLNLPNLSIQEGYTYYPDEGEPEIVPSWDDREFARDYANWQLSKGCDIKTTGTVELTIDAMLYYGLDLGKRIKINGVIAPINIQSITYDVRDFTAKVNLESGRAFKRSVSIQYHGE